MSGWNHYNAKWAKKSCLVCKEDFTPKSGAHKFCSTKCKGKWKYITGTHSTENQYKEISGDWSRYLSRLLYYGGRKRDKLTREDLLNQLEKQNYKCALTGIPLTCILEKGKFSRTNASVDRIIAGGSYTPDNIQIVCRAVNMWRCDTPIQEFVEWCKAVVKHYENTMQFEHGEKEQGHGQNA